MRGLLQELSSDVCLMHPCVQLLGAWSHPCITLLAPVSRWANPQTRCYNYQACMQPATQKAMTVFSSWCLLYTSVSCVPQVPKVVKKAGWALRSVLKGGHKAVDSATTLLNVVVCMMQLY